MIYIIDDFLPEDIIKKINNYLIDFKEIDTGAKKFWVMDTIPEFEKWFENKLSKIEGKEVKSILSFFRISTNSLDTDWRIHCDSIINDQIPRKAIVLYLANRGNDKLNGTAFWHHKDYGSKLPYEQLSTNTYNDLILNEAEDLENWRLDTVVGYKKNRLVSYPSNYFHSKYPNISWEEGRKVFVMFYK
jgi:hypothetical protein